MWEAVAAAQDCLAHAGLEVEEVGTVLVTSEAPPLLAGLAAAVHHRLDLPPRAVALEVGGACTGFLAALWERLRRKAKPVAGAWWSHQRLAPRAEPGAAADRGGM